MKKLHSLLIKYKHLVLSIILIKLLQSSNAVILTPPYFNLVANKKVEATATCGEGSNGPEFYCKLTGSTATDRETSNYANLIQGQYCYYCDPRDPATNHHANYSIDGTEKWWQSPPISRSLEYNKVNLTIDLGQEFHVAYIYIKMANSPRPGVWALEKSIDHGKTFTPWQYFADSKSDCFNHFGVTPSKRIDRDDQVICTTEYSKVLPVEGGEILLSLVNNRPNSKNFTHSDLLQQWTKATTVRLRLLRTKNLLGHLMAVAKQDPTVTRRYFYSIRDISIGGRCVCNGHAQMCDESNPDMPNKLICRCSHNTCGDQCETCCPGFIQKKWRPNKEGNEFKCEPCQCYGHSSECEYDPEVEEKKLSIDIHGVYGGGGVCKNCQDNTDGINCEKCIKGYYRPFDKQINSTDACKKCDCSSERSTGNCAQITGQCECKPEFTGLSCERCADGYTGWPNCIPCTCDRIGSENDACFAPCRCKFGYLGPHCDKCSDGYYGFPHCVECGCGEGRSSLNCDPLSGQCMCRQGYTGLKCNECENGYFSNSYVDENKETLMCTLCSCNQQGTTEEICDKKNNGVCFCKPNYAGERCEKCAEGFFGPQCEPCNCDVQGSQSQTCSESNGECVCKKGRGGAKCDQCAPSYFNYPHCYECNCDVAGSIGQSCDPTTGHCKCHSNFIGDKCSECGPNLFNYPHCEECRCHPGGTTSDFKGCSEIRNEKKITCPCKAHVTGRQCDECRETFWGLSEDKPNGCSECQCDKMGSLNELNICDKTTGQCHCKHRVTSIGCSDCKSGSYSLERNNIFGCKPCECQVGSSFDNDCDRVTGKCRCLNNIVGDTCDRPDTGFYVPTMHQLQYEIEDGVTKNNKPVRYDFDEEVFPDYSWKGYVQLNKIVSPVTQTVKLAKQGTYRMIVNYVNRNINVSRLEVRVRSTEDENMDEQYAVVYLKPANEPTFTTVTINQLSALTLELEAAEYVISFENKMNNLFIDFFVLLPSDYFETPVLEKNVVQACQDYRDEDLCVQYKYLDISQYAHTVVADVSVFEPNIIELDMIKKFNHSHATPLMAKTVSSNMISDSYFNLADNTEYVLLVDFMNMNDDGVQLNLEIDDDQTSVNHGTVFLYKCNLTTFCREVVLNQQGSNTTKNGLPLILRSSDYTRSDIRLIFTTPGSEVIIYKLTLIPKVNFHINHIKMAQHCFVKNGQCQAIEYQPLISTRFELNEQNNPVKGDMPYVHYIKPSNMLFLNRHNSEATVPVFRPIQETDTHMIIVTYYQPNHPSVNISVNIDGENIGSLHAAYCPSVSGCRGIVLFGEYGEEVFENNDIRSVKFMHSGHSDDEIWLDFFELVAPENVNPGQLSATIPKKLTADFITRCASKHFSIEHGSSDFCDRSVVSLSASYNDGALECACSEEGSVVTDECEQFGGQCKCKENIIGRQCSRCKSGYYGFPECKQCECTTGSCNEVTGKCDCPVNVEEENCKTCLDEYFGFHPKFGCQECDCLVESTTSGSNNCNKESGQCDCTYNTDGRRCEHCKAGFFDYPACQECSCNRNGTTDQICSATTAECQCKDNVEGQQCTHCREGTFNLQPSNPVGCTTCFCFGQTTRCISAELYISRLSYFKPNIYEDWDTWKLSNAPESVAIIHSENHEGLELDIEVQLNDKFDEPIYWKAPKPFLGNKVTSYGSAIRYKIKIQMPGTPDAKEFNRPDLIITSERSNMVLIHTGLNQPPIHEVFEKEIELVEDRFYHLATGSTVSREQLMQVLSSISALELRASYYDFLHASDLIEFQMDLAVESSIMTADLSSPVSSAERCGCPPTYRGYSCESCEYGYYKTVSRGPGRFNCERCKCNGHADTCDQDTGMCYECQGFTEGDHCEKCKPGYHKIEHYDGSFECRLCPCPGNTESTVFADTCMIDSMSNNAYYCNCLPGYDGSFCQRCSPGYFGNPRAGIPCQPCACNGNIDMGDYDSCDQNTGECLKCLYNTTGVDCGQCEHWHYGDAVEMKNCQKCECDQCGSESCDEKTGECTCKTNVKSYKCDACGENQWGFNQCQGCIDCECDAVGSTSSQCDPTTGQCKCKPGVDGRKCDRCLADHWNFTETGCLNCQCAKAGVIVTDTGGFSCNATTGYCSCIPGVKGKHCDECNERWVLIKHQGCRKCDSCVDTLLDDVELLFLKAEGIENGNVNSSLTFKAHNKLTLLENKLDKLKQIKEANTSPLPLLSVQNSINNIRDVVLPELLEALAYPIVDKVEDLKTLLKETQKFDKNVEELRNEFEALKKLIDQVEMKEDTEEASVLLENELNLYRTIVEQIVAKNFNRSESYKEQLGAFESLNNTVNEHITNFNGQIADIELIKGQNKYIQDSLVEMRAFIAKAKSLPSFKEKDVSFKAFFTSLVLIREEALELQQTTETNLEGVDKLLQEADQSLEASNTYLETFDDKVESLKTQYAQHDDQYLELKEKCQLAELKANNVSEVSQRWIKKVANLQDGLLAFEMTQIYENIAENLNGAYTTSLETLQELTNQTRVVDQLLQDTDILKGDSKDLLANAQIEVGRKNRVESEIDQMFVTYTDLSEQKKALSNDLSEINNWIESTMASDQTLAGIETDLSDQQVTLETNDQEADVLIGKIRTMDSLRNTLPKQTIRQRRSDNTYEDEDANEEEDESLLGSIEQMISHYQESSVKISEEVTKLQLNENFNSELEKIRNDIYELNNLISGTRDIANEIKVAVNFTDSSYISLRPSNELQSSMVTSISFYVQTLEKYAPIAYIYNSSDPSQYLSVNVQNGRPYFQYRLSSHSFTSVTTDVAINDGEWHKIEIERAGRTATLTVHSPSGEEETASVLSDDDTVVFNIDSTGAKLLLGQYPGFDLLPDELQTTAAFNEQFRGAIDDVKLNGHVYGLWSYEDARNIKGEPKRPISISEEIIEQDSVNAVSFAEGSYMCFNSGFSLYSHRPISIRIRFKTHAKSGLLWIWRKDEGDRNSPYMAIYLESGHLNAVYALGNGIKHYLFDSLFDRTDAKLNNNKQHTIFVRFGAEVTSYPEAKLTILASETLPNEQTKLIKENNFQLESFSILRDGQQCVGGLPGNKRDGLFKSSKFDSFKGCMSQVLVPGFSRALDLQDMLNTNRDHAKVSSGCVSEVKQCKFTKSDEPVYLEFDMKDLVKSDEESIGISFATASFEGLLFYRSAKRGSSGEHGLMLRLVERRLVLSVFEDSTAPIEIESEATYSDSNLHSVYLKKTGNSIALKVDNEVVVESSILSNFDGKSDSLTENSLYVGGLPNEIKIREQTTVKSFEGCVLGIIYNDNDLKFMRANKRTENGTSFSECYKPPSRVEKPLVIPTFKKSAKKFIAHYSKQSKAEEFQPVQCLLTKDYDSTQLRSVGMRFGLNKNSRLEVHDSFPIKITTRVSLKLRTLTPEGLIFYASDAKFGDFLAIWMQEGYVNYAFDLGTGLVHMKTEKKYSDGRFHTLSVTRDLQSGMLTITDRRNQTVHETITGISQGSASSLSVVEPFYFGGIPDQDKQRLPPIQIGLIVTDPFIGCMSDFEIAHTPIRHRVQKIELMSCANNHESGTFFTGVTLTTHASLPNYIDLKDAYEISFEFKSRTQNGVIMYVGPKEVSGSDYALLELVEGDLIYKLNINGVENRVQFMPESQQNELCNSNWVRIQIRKETNGHISLQLKGTDVSSSFNEQLKINTVLTSDIYIGALPTRSGYVKVTETSEPFIGCIRDMSIMRRKNNYNSKVLLLMQLEEGVLNYCPLR